jgi:hypothetical protein
LLGIAVLLGIGVCSEPDGLLLCVNFNKHRMNYSMELILSGQSFCAILEKLPCFMMDSLVRLKVNLLKEGHHVHYMEIPPQTKDDDLSDDFFRLFCDQEGEDDEEYA